MDRRSGSSRASARQGGAAGVWRITGARIGVLHAQPNGKQKTARRKQDDMSGGHFQYVQDKIDGVAWEIDELIRSNEDKATNQYGETIGRNYPPEVIERFRIAARTTKLAAAMVRRVDWLVSCDDGEDNFLERWDEDCEPIAFLKEDK
jgi:hypothetical protein